MLPWCILRNVSMACRDMRRGGCGFRSRFSILNYATMTGHLLFGCGWKPRYKIMSKLIPAVERIVLARALIQNARAVPVPAELGQSDLAYIASVKDLLRQARDLVKFIPQTAGVSVGMKAEVKKIYEEIEGANREILGRSG